MRKVAHRLAGHQAEATREGLVLSYGDDFTGHGLGQTWGFGLLVVDDGLFDLNVNALLRPVGSGDKTVEAREIE